MTPDAEAPPQVLVVCTGNVCRSAMTERLLQAAFDRRYGPSRVLVHSAGTGALVGNPMDPTSSALLTELGGDPEGFRARRLTEQMVADATLVLGASREHRAAAVTMVPRALRRSFTLRELAALVRGAHDTALPAEPGPRLTAVMDLARSRRALVSGGRPEDWDIDDPFRRPDDVYRASRDQITQALTDLSPALGVSLTREV